MVMSVEHRSWFLGDSLTVLRSMDDGSVDLVATDPPLLTDDRADPAEDQPAATGLLAGCPAAGKVVSFAARAEPRKPRLAAGLEFLALRLVEMHRVLSADGSIYVHCEADAHYIRLLMDAVFGSENLRNEIVWCRRHHNGQNTPRSHFPRCHDTLLFYAASAETKTFNPEMKDGPEMENGPEPVLSWWDDCGAHTAVTRHDRPTYPTEKPLALYKRIVAASAADDGMVLDPFAGSGTTCVAAETLGRRWIAIDNNPEACDIARNRLQAECAADIIVVRADSSGGGW